MSLYKSLPRLMKKYAQDGGYSASPQNQNQEDDPAFDYWLGNILSKDPEYYNRVGEVGAREAYNATTHLTDPKPTPAHNVEKPTVDQYIAQIQSVVSNGKAQSQKAQNSTKVSEYLLRQFLGLKPAYLAIWSAYNQGKDNPYSDQNALAKMNQAIHSYSSYQKNLDQVINIDLILNPQLREAANLGALNKADQAAQKTFNALSPSQKVLDEGMKLPTQAASKPELVKSAAIEDLQRLRTTLNLCNTKGFELDASAKEAIKTLLKNAYLSLI